jgi:hypothetical protein
MPCQFVVRRETAMAKSRNIKPPGKVKCNVVARGGHTTTDTTKLKGIAATNRQHRVWFQVYCKLIQNSVHTLTKKANI